MPYILPDRKTAFFFSPKAGGTSLRAFLFHVENGYPFSDYRVQGQTYDANTLLRNSLWKRVDHDALDGYTLFALIRDPVRRFLSAYSNRVLHYGELGRDTIGEALDQRGLPPDPTLAQFARHFRAYGKVSRAIRRHAFPQQSFIGPDPGRYTRIFRLEAVDELVRDVNERFGTAARMPKLQTGGPKIGWSSVDPDTRARILDLVSDDIAFSIHPEYGIATAGAGS